MKKTITQLLLLLTVLSFSACASVKTETPTASAPTTDQEVSTTETAIVLIEDFAFSPETLTVTKGTTVTWTNNDSAPHQILTSPTLANGESFSFTFQTEGTFNYACSLHPSMQGQIIVQ